MRLDRVARQATTRPSRRATGPAIRQARRAGVRAWRARACVSHAHYTAVGPATRLTLGYDMAKVSATIRRWAGHDIAIRSRPVRAGWAWWLGQLGQVGAL